jgi:hypothetical protein
MSAEGYDGDSGRGKVAIHACMTPTIASCRRRQVTETNFLVRDTRLPGHFWADNEVLDVYGEELGPHGFAAYMVLCRNATNGTGKCRISTRKLAKQLGMSAGGAFNALATVVRVGLARQTSRGDRTNPGVYVLADVKALLNPDIAQSKLAARGVHTVSTTKLSAYAVNTGAHAVNMVLTPRTRNKESKRLSSRLTRLEPNPKQHGSAELSESDEHGEQNLKAVRDWLAIKKQLCEKPSEVFWARPAYCFKVAGDCLILSLPPDGRIVQAARDSQDLQRAVRAFGYSGAKFAPYPDNYTLEQFKNRFPELWTDLPAALRRKIETVRKHELALP